MFKRLFWLVAGFLPRRGLVARHRPQGAPGRGTLRTTGGCAALGERATSTGRDLRAAVREGRNEMHRREAEMQTRLGVRDPAG
ncbi:MAG: hypothetical protein M5T61_10950 [Acidimicrobiia bacterium]|nr:hypothetical protein [Acidimicrobiia bacterium]